jgi:hypothetical protein
MWVQHNTVCSCIYIQRNITTCCMTQSHCPMFLFFFKFATLYFKILMYQSSADVSSWFRLKGKSRKTFDIIVPTKSVIFNFQIWGFGGGGLQPGSPPPLGAPLGLCKGRTFLGHLSNYSRLQHRGYCISNCWRNVSSLPLCANIILAVCNLH